MNRLGLDRNAAPFVIGCGELGLTMWRAGDRYAHRLEVGESRVEMLTSIEATADDEWPCSPPLQELQLSEASATISTAFMVGMSGRSHWSLSAELSTVRGARAYFDVACRLHAPPGWLGSSYRIGAGVNANEAARGIELTLPDQRWVVTCTNCRAELTTPGVLCFSSELDRTGGYPRTERWCYCIERAD